MRKESNGLDLTDSHNLHARTQAHTLSLHFTHPDERDFTHRNVKA